MLYPLAIVEFLPLAAVYSIGGRMVRIEVETLVTVDHDSVRGAELLLRLCFVQANHPGLELLTIKVSKVYSCSEKFISKAYLCKC